MSKTNLYWMVNKAGDTAEILLYGYIGDGKINAADFVKELRSLEKNHLKINVRINSGGGSIFEGVAIYNAIKNSPCAIDTYIDGIAGSMGTVIALGGKNIYMSKVAKFMTHKPSGLCIGSAKEMREQAALLDELETTMASIYAERTGKTVEQCRADYMQDSDRWFSAQQALDEKFISAIYDSPAKAAPQALLNEEELTNYFNNQLQNTEPMSEIKITDALKASLPGLDENTGQEQIETLVANLAQRANMVAGLETQVQSLTAAKKTAEDSLRQAQADMTAYKATQANEQVNSMVDTAVTENRCSAAAGELLKKQYAGKPDELKALLGTMPPYTPIAQRTGSDVDAVELGQLIAMTGGQLFASGKFDRLKELSPTHYKLKYKDYFGAEPE